MEFNNFNKDPFKSEANEADDTGSEKSKKKKSAGSAAVLAEVATVKQRPDQKPAALDSLWQKLKGDKPQQKSPEVPLYGIPKPEKSVTDNPISLSSEQESDTILDQLSPQELKEAAREYTELRLQETDGEIHELPIGQQSSAAAEAAAGATLLQNLQANLQVGNQSVETAIENATIVTNERINDSMIGNSEESKETDDEQVSNSVDSPTEQEPFSSESIDAKSDLTVEIIENAEDTKEPKQFALGGAGGNGEPPEMPPPDGNFADLPPPLPPPIGNGYTDHVEGEWFSSPAPAEAVEEAGSDIPRANALRNERAAQSRGLLVGLLVGNFIGKRRGRSKTEKQLIPVQRKLEKQITNLQETISRKEQYIKSAAREKFSTLTSRNERQQFMHTMTTARQTARTESFQPAITVNQTAELKATPGTRYAEAALIGSRAVGELVAGGILMSAIGANKSKSETISSAHTTITSERKSAPRDQQPVIRFDKKAEQFSRTELIQTAEKIKIEGVDLKEMFELGRINENGLRRIVAEFLEGGSVSAALSKEVQEKELKFERDPRMKQLFGSGGGKSAGGGSGSYDTFETQAIQNIGLSAMNMTFQSDNNKKTIPVPDQATLQKVRNQQIASIGGTTLILVVLILVALWITS